MSEKYVRDADGHSYEYRLVASRLERRNTWSSYWSEVHANDFLKMTPAELRHVADVLEVKSHA